jgi:predicted metal-dependent phosphoesterase TrpH
MGLADLHIHTIYSWDGTSTVSAVLKQVVDHTNLDVIAITDHDEIRGAYEAIELAPAYGVEVIPGCEISTADGHLLAYFIQQKIRPGLSLKETVLRVGEQGGLCVAAHPAARGANSLSPAAIRQAVADPEIARVMVGIETFNAGLVHLKSNQIAQKLAERLPVARLGNSDAHLLWVIGRGMTEFYGWTALNLRYAMESHRTRAVPGPSYSSARLVGHWLSRFLLRRAGWVTGNAGPQAPLKLGRLARQDITNQALRT